MTQNYVVCIENKDFDSMLMLIEHIKDRFDAAAKKRARGIVAGATTSYGDDIVMQIGENEHAFRVTEGIIDAVKAVTANTFYIAPMRAVGFDFKPGLNADIKRCGVKFSA